MESTSTAGNKTKQAYKQQLALAQKAADEKSKQETSTSMRKVDASKVDPSEWRPTGQDYVLMADMAPKNCKRRADHCFVKVYGCFPTAAAADEWFQKVVKPAEGFDFEPMIVKAGAWLLVPFPEEVEESGACKVDYENASSEVAKLLAAKAQQRQAGRLEMKERKRREKERSERELKKSGIDVKAFKKHAALQKQQQTESNRPVNRFVTVLRDHFSSNSELEKSADHAELYGASTRLIDSLGQLIVTEKEATAEDKKMMVERSTAAWAGFKKLAATYESKQSQFNELVSLAESMVELDGKRIKEF